MLQEIFIYLIIAIFIGISQSAGIGGGPILNISLMLGLGYDAKDSMSITYIFLMGGAFASMIKNKNKKNTKTGNPLMDYTLIMITLPGAVSGSLFGTILNHFISDFLITIMFVILLTYLIINSYQKLRQINKSSESTLQNKLISPSQQMNIIQNNQFHMIEKCDRLQQILYQQKQIFPKQKLRIIIHIFLYTLIILLCKGGRNYDSFIGLESCGIGSWILILAHFVLSYLYSKSIAIKQYRIQVEKISLGYVYDNPNDKMSQAKMNACMFYGFLAGVTGGMLGLGGAIILVPVWLNKGIPQDVAASSSGPLIFFSALVSFTLGLLSGKYSSFFTVFFYFILAFVGSYVVKDIVTYISQKYQLKSMIFILLIIVMSTSLFTLLPYEFNNYLTNPEQFTEFGKLC